MHEIIASLYYILHEKKWGVFVIICKTRFKNTICSEIKWCISINVIRKHERADELREIKRVVNHKNYLLLLKSFFECDKIYTNKKCGITHKLFIGVSLWL